ncbi:antiterminator Q family protein [Martelella alba]|uniref:Antitermination protein Q n=1 Tax=Martelella alba TaxID=2590451 RepID=A0ABY2SD56_9HYPH|nr:antiterminator Q family protein [Martelella alba]TKI02013.1 antitermination protein Q [Martelella alba]
MRDIQLVLERWGSWARDNSGVDFSHIAAGFKGLLPYTSKIRDSCCDDDGMAVDAAVLVLKKVRRPDELNMVVLHYVYCMSKRSIGRHYKISEGRVRQEMQVAEAFVDACLYMAEVTLEMDRWAQKENIYAPDPKSLVRYAKCVVTC